LINWRATLLHTSNYASYALPLAGGVLSGALTINNTLRINSTEFGANQGYIYFGDGTLDRWIGYNGTTYQLRTEGANNTIIHSGNYNSYTPTLTGAGASGAWGISITGNASYLASNGGNQADQLQYWNAYNNASLNPDTSYWYGIRMAHGDAETYYNATLAISFFADVIKFRRKAGGVNADWQTLWHTGNDGFGFRA